VVPLNDGTILYSVSTYLRPTYFSRFDETTGKSEISKLAQTSPVKFDDAEVVRTFATSKDGTKVPITIIRKMGTKLDQANPALLTGYGGYSISLTPRFLGPDRRLWLDGGGVYVVANLRGGGEYGEEWHRLGALTRKQNVFDDFIAAARYLIGQRYTTPERLAIIGGSNGGLLMGASFTQHPELFHAVVSQVGVYDMLRVELDPNGTFNTTEFGSVKDADQFQALYAYSPYHHVIAGTKYPAIFMATGENDGRVNPMHSRKNRPPAGGHGIGPPGLFVHQQPGRPRHRQRAVDPHQPVGRLHRLPLRPTRDDTGGAIRLPQRVLHHEHRRSSPWRDSRRFVVLGSRASRPRSRVAATRRADHAFPCARSLWAENNTAPARSTFRVLPINM